VDKYFFKRTDRSRCVMWISIVSSGQIDQDMLCQ